MRCTAYALFTLLTYAPFFIDIVECESTECGQMRRDTTRRAALVVAR